MADTEVGSLVVKMKADLSDYMTKLDQMDKSTTTTSSKMNTAFAGIASGVLKASAAIGTAALASVHSAMQWGTAVDDLGDKTGMAGEEASKLLVIAKRVGIGTEEASGMFAKFARSAYEAAQAQAAAKVSGEDATDAYSKLKIELLNTDGTMKGTSELFGEVKDKIAEMPDGLQKTATEMEIFGRSGTQMHDLLNMTNEEMQETIDKAQAMGLILSTNSASAWEGFERDINSAKLSLASFGISVGNEIMPMLKDFLNTINSAAKAFSELDPETKKTIMDMVKLGIEVGVSTKIVLSATGAVSGMAKALGIMRWATIAAAGPWIALAIAIGEAIPVLRKWNEESQNQKEVKQGGKYVIVGNHTEFKTFEQLQKDFKSSGNSDDYDTTTEGFDPYADVGKKKPAQPVITASSGGGDTTKDTKTALQEYQEQSSKLVSTWQDMVNLNEISRSGFRDLLNERLAGLEQIAVGEDEELDKQQAVKSLQAQILSLNKEIRNDAIETAAKKATLGEITIEQYVEEIKKIKETATTEQERLELAEKLAQANDNLIADQITAQDRLTNAKKDALSIEEEVARHEQAMETTFAANTLTAKRNVWAEETALKKQNLADTYALESQAINDKISLYEKLLSSNIQLTESEKKQYENYLEQKRALDAKYILNKTQAENDYAEKVAGQQRQIINANNDMISSLILNTKSGHDILSDMWTDFVKQTVAKLWSINSETNIFTQLLGGLFGGSGGGSSTITSGNDSGFLVNSIGTRASGGPVNADTTYLVGEKGPELFKPSYNGTIIPNSAITSGGAMQSNGTVFNMSFNVNQTFSGQQDASVVAQIKASIPYIKSEIRNAIQNETSMRNAVKGATT